MNDTPNPPLVSFRMDGARAVLEEAPGGIANPASGRGD